MESYNEQLIRWLTADQDRMRVLYIVQDVEPAAYVSAGFIRNMVWDRLHGYAVSTPLNDVDVIYYDKKKIDPDIDLKIERRLRAHAPDINWQVRNQARMHVRNGHGPYQSIDDAMRRWPETVTAVAARLSHEWEFIAPYGLNDLFDLKIRKSPYCESDALFQKRVQTKGWLKVWPLLKLCNKAEREDKGL